MTNAVLILHGTHSLPAVWKPHLVAFLAELRGGPAR